MFAKILIANRGEIACRIAATARKMGIHTVAVYSEVDAQSKHVAACDEAICIGPAAAKESYLRGDKIIAAALASGAQALHPGVGFLSENADFAQAVLDAGLVFIGPPPAAMRIMGFKSAAKTLMKNAGVPLVPGYHGAMQDADFLQAQADLIGYPVLLKPSAGGGGKGMRVVENSTDFKSALASCQREAISAFGDDQVLIEKYLPRARHIEIQIFADTHGNCIHLFERDCSVQRRHQKVLEEAPAPGMSEQRRTAVGAAAIAAAQTVSYVGAGTVEFIANLDGSFYFMEMNTRLQVEHPVTEMITGLDLVEWQLRVASGEALPLQQADVVMRGHALEARIYAENPENGFLPSTGTLRHLRTPAGLVFSVPDAAHQASAAGTSSLIRIDSGVREGDAISPFYDPMIAKLIVWGIDREAALRQMLLALADYQVVGVASNVAFLKRLVACRAFTEADLDTGLIEQQHASLFPPVQNAPYSVPALAAVALLVSEAVIDDDPWTQTDGWRLHGALQRPLNFSTTSAAYCLRVLYGTNRWDMTLGETLEETGNPVGLVRHEGCDWWIRIGADLVQGRVVRVADVFHVFDSDGSHWTLAWQDPLALAYSTEAAIGRLTAPMPGRVLALLTAVGAKVDKGQPLMVMEAMKMEHTISAPQDGVIGQIFYAVGDQVDEGAPLLAFQAAPVHEN